MSKVNSKPSKTKRTKIRVMVTTDARREVKELWKKEIKPQLAKYYDITEKIVTLSDKLTPTEICRLVKSKGYAAAIHDFSPRVDRLPNVAFSHPVLLNENVLYLRRERYRALRTAVNIFVFQYLPIILLMSLVGLILYLLYKTLGLGNISFSDFLYSMFGSFNYSSNLKKGTFKSRFIIYYVVMIVILILSSYVFYSFNAYITTRLLIQNDNVVDVKTIRGMKLLCPKGYPVGGIYQTFGANVEFMEASEKKVVAHFLANKNKYDGITLYHEDHAFYPELERTPTVFGFSAGAFAVNRKYPKLLDRLNGMILESNDSLKTLELCRKYNPKQPEFYCVL